MVVGVNAPLGNLTAVWHNEVQHVFSAAKFEKHISIYSSTIRYLTTY